MDGGNFVDSGTQSFGREINLANLPWVIVLLHYFCTSQPACECDGPNVKQNTVQQEKEYRTNKDSHKD